MSHNLCYVYRQHRMLTAKAAAWLHLPLFFANVLHEAALQSLPLSQLTAAWQRHIPAPGAVSHPCMAIHLQDYTVTHNYHIHDDHNIICIHDPPWLTGLGLGTPSRYLARTISWNACKLL